MTATILQFPRTRMLKNKLRLIEYEDARDVAFARLVERMAEEMERREYDPRPTDGAA